MKAVMYGAGNIGRGFIGKVFSESGYEVCFVDVAKETVDKLNDEKEYPVKIVCNDYQKEVIVENVYAVNGMEIEMVAEQICYADIMATAVGVNMLNRIVKPICAGIKKRIQNNDRPLNIIICENLLDADKYLRDLIEQELESEYKGWLDKNLGLVEASIGRMVPVMTEEMKEGNILKVWVEPYDELPLDKDGFVGDIPKLNNIVPFSPFGFYIKRKLFIHNMGHAMCAYLGWQKGYSYIYECIADKEIKEKVEAAMKESASALNAQYGIDIAEINDNVYDLIERFGNRILGDTVARVGRDPIRKLGINDRLVGAMLYCESQGVEPNNIIDGVVAGLKYDNVDDESAVEIQSAIQDSGIEESIKEIWGMNAKEPLFKSAIDRYYESLN